MRYSKLAGNVKIKITSWVTGNLAADRAPRTMTVAESLVQDSQGRNEWWNSRGTVSIIAELDDPDAFEREHDVFLASPTVFMRDSYPHVRILSDAEASAKYAEQ
jgi:hypothetical protein